MSEEQKDQTPAEGTQATKTGEEQPNKGTGGEGESSKGEPAIDYKEKFSASSREAQRLVAENKILQAERENEKNGLLAQLKEKEDFINKLSETDPEKVDVVKTQDEIRQLKEKFLLSEERIALDDYIKLNPNAEPLKDSLRKLGRAFPNKKYSELFDETFKPLISNDEEEKAKIEKEKKKKESPESGDDTISEMVGGMSINDFNKLPVKEREKKLKSLGLI